MNETTANQETTTEEVLVDIDEYYKEAIKDFKMGKMPKPFPKFYVNRRAGFIVKDNIAIYLKSKSQYRIDSNGVWTRISKKRHER